MRRRPPYPPGLAAATGKSSYNLLLVPDALDKFLAGCCLVHCTKNRVEANLQFRTPLRSSVGKDVKFILTNCGNNAPRNTERINTRVIKFSKSGDKLSGMAVKWTIASLAI